MVSIPEQYILATFWIHLNYPQFYLNFIYMDTIITKFDALQTLQPNIIQNASSLYTSNNVDGATAVLDNYQNTLKTLLLSASTLMATAQTDITNLQTEIQTNKEKNAEYSEKVAHYSISKTDTTGLYKSFRNRNWLLGVTIVGTIAVAYHVVKDNLI